MKLTADSQTTRCKRQQQNTAYTSTQVSSTEENFSAEGGSLDYKYEDITVDLVYLQIEIYTPGTRVVP